MTSRGTKYWDSGAIPLIGPDILGDIITEVSDVGVVIDDTGQILSVLVNPNYDTSERFQSLEGTNLRDVLTAESKIKFKERLATFLDDGPTRAIELNHTGKGRIPELPVRYSFHRIGPDGAILMLGRDLRPIAEMQQQLVSAQLALEQDYEAHREFDTRFRVLMAATSEAVVFVSAQTGKITDANQAAIDLTNVPNGALVGTSLDAVFQAPGRGSLIDRLSSLAISDSAAVAEVTLGERGASMHLMPTLFRVSGERVLLCRIEPLEMQKAPRDALADNLRGLYLKGPDAIVFATATGRILSANDSFLDLISVAQDINIRGNDLTEYLKRGGVDLKVMTENATRSGPLRMYATKVAGTYGSPRSVEISVTPMIAGEEQIFAFTMRDASRSDRGQPAATDPGIQPVVELVGSATLKDIVAETTNVVEKMCIETAVELTMNNRVAAAEMLGLSRQSLYVKLRKYDLLGRD